MPRLRAVWAVAQAFIAFATIGWGVYVLVSTREVAWGSGIFAAAVFFIVTIFLFAANHDDGRIVGLFGLAVFLLTNALLIFTLLQKACEAGAPPNCVADYTGLPKFQIASGWTREQVALVMVGSSLIVAIPESLLLLFGHGEPRHKRERLADTPPPM